MASDKDIEFAEGIAEDWERIKVGVEVSLTQHLIHSYGHNLNGWKGRLARAVQTAKKLELKRFPSIEELEAQFGKEHGFAFFHVMNGAVTIFLAIVLFLIVIFFVSGSGEFFQAVRGMLPDRP